MSRLFVERPKGRRERSLNGRQLIFANAGTRQCSAMARRLPPFRTWRASTLHYRRVGASAAAPRGDHSLRDCASQTLECQTVSLHFRQPVGGNGGGTSGSAKICGSLCLGHGLAAKCNSPSRRCVRLTEYDYFQEQIVKFIVLKGGSFASSGRDREFTDWNALADFADRFLDRLATDRSPLYPRAPSLG